ncbi:MmpS family transport accessory protein [Actinoplanes missouriensis]|uniref:MmpS family transport accessory protein n=1 Tax=Actinoplanes missouriensis TaxID=1866 RepID=UPI0033CB738D
MSDPRDPSEPRQPPRPPQFTPGQATPPVPPDATFAAPGPDPTSQFPPVAQEQFPPVAHEQFPPVAYEPVNYAPPGYSPEPGYAPDYTRAGYPPPPPPPPGGYTPPPRKSKTPLIALIVAISLLLCGGVVTSGVLIVRSITDKAQEAIEPITNPTLPELPALPTFPTDLPDVPGIDPNREITVTYEVTGDGPVEILYTEQLGAAKVLNRVELPWKVTTTMTGVALVSVFAQRTGGEGSVTCRATVDGKEVAEQTGSGAFASTTCTQLVFE